MGENVLTFTQNGIPYRLTVIRKENAEEKELSSFEILSVSPVDSEEILALSTTFIPIQVEAPAGSSVYVTLGDQRAYLKPSLHSENEERDLKEIYTGTLKIPNIPTGDGYHSLGRFRVFCVKGVKKCEKLGGEIQVIPSDLSLCATVISDYAYVKRSTDSSFYEDFTPASVGMTSQISGAFNGYYRLLFGGFVTKEDVFVEAKDLSLSRITRIECFADEKESGVLLTVGASPPVNCEISDNVVKITLFETTAQRFKKLSPAKKDHLFQKIEVTENESDGSVSLLFTLKSVDNYYGFDYSYENGKVRLSFRQPQSISTDPAKPLAGKVIVVDAGHGGSDPGALGYLASVNEKDLNLAIALSLEEKLSALGATVVMTRSDDHAVSLGERMAVLTETDPDLSVSVHHNSVNETKDANLAGGTMGLYWANGGKMLADCVQDSVSKALAVPSYGASRQMLALCRNHRFPQALVEVSFICSPTEYEVALKESYAALSADAIVEGILQWYAKQSEFCSEV